MTRREQSFGIIPLKKRKNEWVVLLVQLHAGHWGFPKGHPDKNETPLETAQRELFEETGLTVSKILSPQPIKETYFFKFKGELIYKTVSYYIAEVKGRTIKLEEEIYDLKWVPLKEAVAQVTFDQAKEICQKAFQYMQSLSDC